MIDDDDQDDEGRWPARPDIIGELAVRLRAKHGDGDVRARLAGKLRVKPDAVREASILDHWRQRAKDIVASWLDRLNDDELEQRLWIEQRALEVCRPHERGDCQERLDSTLKVIARRGGIEPRPESPNKRPEVVATQAAHGEPQWPMPPTRRYRR